MTKNWYLLVFVAILLGVVATLRVRLIDAQAERDRYRANAEILIGQAEHYKTKDSLNAIEVGALRLTLDEFKKARKADAELVKSLRTKIADLSALTTLQSQTIVQLNAIPRDTIILRDSIPIKAQSIEIADEWLYLNGIAEKDRFYGELRVKDSLVIAETIKYKRFLGFLWKTKRVKSRKIDVVSKCPYTYIQGCEHIVLE